MTDVAQLWQIPARPEPVQLSAGTTALLLIDMQRDFLEPGGFGAALGNDVALLQQCIEPCRKLLDAARAAGMAVFHTREGHRPDLSDLFVEKWMRAPAGRRIGDAGPNGRILVRGEPGHAIIESLAPLAGEPVIDKPGKGAFYATDLELLLRCRGITALIICGVTTEVCVHTTLREANDRGFRVVVPGDCCASYFPQFHAAALEMICAQGGIFGYVCASEDLIAAMQA